jgi:hypothetical protein
MEKTKDFAAAAPACMVDMAGRRLDGEITATALMRAAVRRGRKSGRRGGRCWRAGLVRGFWKLVCTFYMATFSLKITLPRFIALF